MTNIELKHKLWNELSKKYTHLNDFCSITLRGIDEDNQYFHPTFTINEDVFISGQCDIKNSHVYALRFVWLTKGINIDIADNLLDPLIIGCHTNKEAVELAMDTMAKVRNHINTLNGYTNDYITNILIGNSIDEVTDVFINELKANQKLISFMQKINTKN